MRSRPNFAFVLLQHLIGTCAEQVTSSSPVEQVASFDLLSIVCCPDGLCCALLNDVRGQLHLSLCFNMSVDRTLQFCDQFEEIRMSAPM